jgi:hypothetical protein
VAKDFYKILLEQQEQHLRNLVFNKEINMDPLTMAALVGGAGLLKSELLDRPREERQRELAATTARWSPWTGMAPNAIQGADPFGSALEGATAGAMMGQQIDLTGGSGKTKDIAEVTSQPELMQTQQFPFAMMEAQNQSIDPMLMARRPMYGTRM